MQNNPYPGKFIVFDGLDGSGQSTQAGLLRDFLITKGLEVVLGSGQPTQADPSKDFLAGKGFEVILTKEPTKDSQAGKKIRQVLNKDTRVEPVYLQELFTQDRKEHLENLIIPALKENKMVISDRYFFSTFAYGVSDGLDLDWLIKINDEFLVPDMTFILKVKPETCLARIEKRGNAKTLFEETERLRKVWQTYESLPSRIENVYMIEGEKPIKEVFEDIKSLVHSKLNL